MPTIMAAPREVAGGGKGGIEPPDSPVEPLVQPV